MGVAVAPAAFYAPGASASTPLRRSFCTRLVLVYMALLLDVLVVHWASPGGRARTAEALAFHLLGELYVRTPARAARLPARVSE